VLGPDEKPVARAEVALIPNILGEELTNEEGLFTIENVRPDSYTLIARPPNGAKPEVAKDGSRTALVPTYYPSSVDQSLAQPIKFSGLGDLNGYEIRMRSAQVHRVRGIVLDEDAKPSPGAELMLFPIPPGTPAPMGLSFRSGERGIFALGLREPYNHTSDLSVPSGKDGRFEFFVPSGEWRVNVESGVLSGMAAFSVGKGDVEDLEIHVAAPFKLNAAVERKGEDLPGDPALNPSVLLVNPEGNEFASLGAAKSDVLTFDRVSPGRYNAFVLPGFSMQIFLGENEVTGAFPIRAGGPRLRLVFKKSSGTIRGTVEQGEGATVVLIPQRVDGVAFGQILPSGAGGSFELDEVPPGDYYIAAFDHMDDHSPSGATLSLLASRGTSVKVEERSVANVTLSVIAAPR
jgi:hypothetical protein